MAKKNSKQESNKSTAPLKTRTLDYQEKYMQPTFEQYIEGSGALLECPACNGNHLHHEKIEVFERADDESTGVHVSVTNGKVIEDKNMTGNTSSRRHGLSIYFKCEQCPATPVLTIAQHKGNTWVDFK